MYYVCSSGFLLRCLGSLGCSGGSSSSNLIAGVDNEIVDKSDATEKGHCGQPEDPHGFQEKGTVLSK